MVIIANSTAVISGYCQAVLYASLKSGLNLELKKYFSETVLAAIIDVWVVC